MHKMFAAAFLLLLLASIASAQIPKGNVFFGYSYNHANVFPGGGPTFFSNGNANLNGWNGSLEGKVLPFVGIVADLGGYYGSQSFTFGCEAIPSPPCLPSKVNVDARVYTFLFGPRVSASVGKFTPFAHALFGAAHASGSGSGFSGSDTSFATALGGGLDYKLIPAVAWRFQGDYLQTRFFSNTQSDFRFSTGIALRF